jgi:hypothetical protein
MGLEQFICFTAWQISILGLRTPFLASAKLPDCVYVGWAITDVSTQHSLFYPSYKLEIITNKIKLRCCLLAQLTAMAQEVNFQKS